MPTTLASRLAATRERIAAAARAAGRDPADVTLVVVTKFHPPETVAALAAAGVRDFGESRWPEVRDKVAAAPRATWHFVGQLQTNKARQVARTVAAIHSVDRPELVDAIAAGDARPLLFLQVDLAGDDPSRGGAAPADVPPLAERALAAGLPLAGVMAVAPPHVEPARAFALLRTISEAVTAIDPQARSISAGMSGDLEAAIAAGATHVRVGSAIVGARPARG